ncbi:MAG TPA: SDR family oxidoreductase [Caldilineaceae bacterium]|nr:SDR family oxidoreductase [Caldilineaceae bacterium]
MDLHLENKVAIVTGGASGMGATVATMLAAEGVKVVLADIQTERGERVAGEIQQTGGYARFIHTDVSVRAAVKEMVERTLVGEGQIDILCNIAGPGASAGILETDEAEYNRQLDGHLRGVFNCTQEVLPHMMARRYGKIINMGSFTAYGAVPSIPAYCAAFGGIIAYSKAVARFAAPYNINVNTVSPGNIYTPMTAAWLDNPERREALHRQIPIGRIGEPADVAAMFVFLASDRARHIVGADINISGGQLLY